MSQAGSVLAHPVITGLTGAGEGLDEALSAAAWQLSDADVETGLAILLALQARAAALQGVLLGEADVRDLKARTQASTVERWLGDRYRLSATDAAARLQETAQFSRHRLVAAALERGTVTVEQATVTATALDRIGLLPDLTDQDRGDAAAFLLDQCAALTPRDLARAGRAVLEALSRTPSVDDPAEAAALDREMERAEQDAQHAERNDLTLTRRRGRLRALLDLGPLGEATLTAWLRGADQPHPGTDGLEDQRPRSERRADTLLDLLTDTIGHDPLPPAVIDGAPAAARGPASPPATLTITTTLAELRAGLAGTGRLDTGATLPAATVRQFACDAHVLPAVLGGPAHVLDLGRTTRTWTRAQRRAAALRDRGCVAPGCHQPPAACHVHHCQHWVDGGPTDLANAALLCGFHHRMVHRQNWTITPAPNGHPQLTPPATIDPQQRPRQHHRYRLTLLTKRHRT